mgnify:CR=1 FL=1
MLYEEWKIWDLIKLNTLYIPTVNNTNNTVNTKQNNWIVKKLYSNK